MKICVCICTFDRHERVHKLLSRLQDILHKENSFSLELLVIDNKCSVHTRDQCQSFETQFPVPLLYYTEQQRGISEARNSAVNAARERAADFVAFIDDDDIPNPDWLERLWSKQLETGADIVFGSWALAPDAPKWAGQSGVFKSEQDNAGKRKSRAKGLPRMASTCNVLIAQSTLENAALGEFTFNPELSEFGGEDKDFFVRAIAAGASVASATDSIVIRHHEPERYTVKGLFQRGFKNGCSRMRWMRTQEGFSSAIKTVSFSIAKLLWVLLKLPFSLFSTASFMHEIYRLGKSCGAVYFFFTGKSNSYYSKPHTTLRE